MPTPITPYPISNAHAPYNNVNANLVNIDNSHNGSNLFSNTKIPYGPNTMPAPGSNVQSAAGIYQNGGKKTGINRSKINKISRKYKMKGSRKTCKRRIRHIKSRLCKSAKYRRHSKRRYNRQSRRMKGGIVLGGMKGGIVFGGMKGGAFQSPMQVPNYPAGYSQYQNNNGSLSNTYSLGGQLSPSDSALANPPIYQNVSGNVDNLNHNTLNAYGNIGSGSGFVSRGSF